MSNVPENRLTFTVDAHGGSRREQEIALNQALIAGWTSRDRQAMEAHIAELEELGVTRPARTPIFYRVGVSRFTSATVMEVPGNDSSGEAEFALIRTQGRTYVGLASDHTDRKAETFNVTVSKQMCDKPIAPVLWPMEDLTDHWDELILRSHAIINGERRLYQEGRVAGILSPDDLIGRFGSEGGSFADGSVMLCGTFPAIGGLQVTEHFDMELEDPVLKRRIQHGYRIVTLPNEG